MDQLDWYVTHIHQEAYGKKAYELAYFICPNHEIVCQKIIPCAVEIASKSLRNSERTSSSQSHWKISLSPLQLFQIAVIEAILILEKSDQDRIPTPYRILCSYVKFLTLLTLQKKFFLCCGWVFKVPM